MDVNDDTTTEDHAIWGENLKSFFIESLYEEAKKGLQTSTLDKKTWMKISNDIHSKFNKRLTVTQLKTKWNRLRRSTREFESLIETTGFGWDPDANTFTVSDEVWDSYLQQNPKPIKYQKKGLLHFSLLKEIFAGTIATGRNAIGPQTAANVPCTAPPPSVNVEAVHEGTDESHEVQRDNNHLGNAEGSSSRSRNKKKTALESAVELLAKSVSLRSEASVQRTNDLQQYLAAKRARLGDTSPAETSTEDPHSIDICIQLLDEIEDLDDITYETAIKTLTKDKDFRGTFVRLKPERRRGFILSLAK